MSFSFARLPVPAAIRWHSGKVHETASDSDNTCRKFEVISESYPNPLRAPVLWQTRYDNCIYYGTRSAAGRVNGVGVNVLPQPIHKPFLCPLDVGPGTLFTLRDNSKCSISPPGTHPSSVRSAVRASSIIPKCENIPRGSERSYLGNGGTVIYNDDDVVDVAAEDARWLVHLGIACLGSWGIALDVAAESSGFPRFRGSCLKIHKDQTAVREVLQNPTAQGREEGKGHMHHESPQVVTPTVPLGSPGLRSAVASLATGPRRSILIHVRIFYPPLRPAVRVLLKRNILSSAHAKPLLHVMVVIEEASVSVTCSREDGDSRTGYDGEGSGSKGIRGGKGRDEVRWRPVAGGTAEFWMLSA
ncbi:hypothetical protein F5888DRAFT_1638820 [Russula emetica]|nr:hypothetical protein F5888DRAFT_1638820 [Russula emetica]